MVARFNLKICILIFIGLSLFQKVNCQNSYLLLYEKNTSPVASAENIIAVRQSLFDFQNQYLPNRIKGANKWINVGYRLLKVGTINRFFDDSFKLFQHEFFGHGYRQREFGYTNNSVNLKISFFGFSGFSRLGTPTPNRPFTHQERVMWSMGGSEATSILSETMFAHWVRSEKILLTDTNLYINGFKIGILATTSYDDDFTSDTELYLKEINKNYGFIGIDNYQLTLKKIRRHSLVELLNPYLYYSIFSFSKNFIWEGKEEVNLPMIKFGNIKYMLYLKYWLTPYGSEFQFNNVLKTEKRIFRYNIRLGDNTFDTASWGTGISIENLIENNWLKFYPDLNVWYQPALELGDVGQTIVKEKGLGGAVRLNSYFKFIKGTNQKKRTNIYISLGYKTKGYLPGEALTDKFIWRFGLNFVN